MNIRKANRDRLAFWAEFTEDAMAAFQSAGFSRAECVQLIASILQADVHWMAVPPGFEQGPPQGGFH